MKWYKRTVPENTVPTLEEIRAYTEMDIWFTLYMRGILTLEQAIFCGLIDVLEAKRSAEVEIARYKARFGALDTEEMEGS